jgi:transcriptional regulator
MYIPNAFVQQDLGLQHNIMREYSFATLITYYQNACMISHVPMLLDDKIAPYGRLSWHVAKANPHAEIFAKAEQVICVFQGPHYYISPLWYGKLPNAPTWNYAVVHAYGKAELLAQAELAADLDMLVAQNEESLHGEHAYQVPAEFKASLIDHIVGFRMDIKKLEAKFKLSQNRSQTVQDNVLNALQQQSSSEAQALAKLMQVNKKS